MSSASVETSWADDRNAPYVNQLGPATIQRASSRGGRRSLRQVQQQQLRAHMLWLGRILVVATTHLLQAVVSCGAWGSPVLLCTAGLGPSGAAPRTSRTCPLPSALGSGFMPRWSGTAPGARGGGSARGALKLGHDAVPFLPAPLRGPLWSPPSSPPPLGLCYHISCSAMPLLRTLPEYCHSPPRASLERAGGPQGEGGWCVRDLRGFQGAGMSR